MDDMDYAQRAFEVFEERMQTGDCTGLVPGPRSWSTLPRAEQLAWCGAIQDLMDDLRRTRKRDW